MSQFYHWEGDDLLLDCRLQPKASKDEIVGPMDSQLKIRITAPPVDGKANQHLIQFLAKTFKVSKSSVRIEKGELGRSKRVRICAPVQIPAKLKINKAL